VRLAALGGVIMAVFSTLVGFSPGLWVLGITMAATGLGKSFIDPTHNSLLADHFSPDVRARVFAFHRAANSVGQFIGPLVAGFLAYYFTWRVPFIIFGPVILVAALAALLIKEPIRGRFEREAAGATGDVAATEEPPPSMAESWRMCWKVDSLRRIYRTLPFLAPAIVGFVSFASFFYADEFGLDERSRGIVASVTEPVQIAGLVIGASVGTRLFMKNPKLVFRFLGRVTLLVAALAVGFALSPAWFVDIGEIRLPWVSILFNAGISGSLAFLIPGILASLSVAIPPRSRAMGFSMMSVFVIPGLAFLPIIGALGDAWGIRAGMLMMVPMFAIGGFAVQSVGGLIQRDMNDVWTTSAARAEVLHRRREGQAKLLLVKDLNVAYGDVQVLFDVSLEIDEGEVVALLGTNGAGKSTLLKAISGITEADRGAVIFDGVDVTHAPPNEIAAKGIVQMPGGKGVFPTLSIEENLRAAAWMDRRDTALVEERIANVYETFPALSGRRGEAAVNLSGGQQQMLALGMAFLSRPRLLMIDELSLGLAPLVVEQLLGIVREIAATGTTVVIVEQSVNVALTLADRAYFMEKGEIRFEGPTKDLLDRPDVLRSVFMEGAGSTNGSGNGSSTSAAAPSTGIPATPSGAPMLRLTCVTKRFGGITAVHDVSLEVGEGEILGFLGPNGAGKTTLFDIVSGFTVLDSGRIELDGRDVTHLAPHQRAAVGLGRSFQDAALFPSLTVEQTLAVAHELTVDVRNPLLEASWMPAAFESEESVGASVDHLVELFGLQAYRSKFVHELSTGSRRIVDIASLVAHRPRVVLLDEPSSGIAQRESEALVPVIRRMRDELGFTILVIEHDMALLTSVADRMVALEAGSVIANGSPGDVLADPGVVQSYLGGSQVAIARSGPGDPQS
jgi:branched-chain amino acid transport system ATP-binding protein